MFITFGFQFTYSTLYLSMGQSLREALNICRQKGDRFYSYNSGFAPVYQLNGVILC